MDTKGLMIGNLAQDKYGKILTVVELSRDGVRFESNDGRFSYPLSPIPLTEEWLYSFGFKWYGDWDAFVANRESNKELSIIKSKGIFIVCDINLVPEIKHVHQLQNLYLALTGEELKYIDK